MKAVWVVAVLACMALTSGVWAQGTPRVIGMGGTFVANQDDAGSWGGNPARLPVINAPVPDGKAWGHDVIGAVAQVDDTNIFGLTWSGAKPGDRFGVGAGFVDVEDGGNVFGAGVGVGFAGTPLTVGANFTVLNPDVGDEETLLNAGVLYRFLREDRAPVAVGLVVNDITDELGGPVWSAGVAVPVTDRLTAALDLVDLSEEAGDVRVNAGAEYIVGKQREWALRFGEMDTGTDNELSLGVGYKKAGSNWRADFAWVDLEPDGLWTVGVGVNL